MRNSKKMTVLLILFMGLATVTSCKSDENDIAKLYSESTNSKYMGNDNISSSRQNAITRAVQRCSPAIVGINVTEVRKVVYLDPFFDNPAFSDPFFQQFRDRMGGGSRTQEYNVKGLGSGYIISPDGYILTNHHVAGNARKIVVTMTDGEKYDAEIIGSDMTTDVALLKINAKNLPYLSLGNSDEVMVGEWSIAFGNPFGLFDKNAKPTVTVGVISNLGIDFTQPDEGGTRVYKGMLQTDAAISSGNSGGPLINSLGEVIGMNTVIFSTAQSNRGAGSIGIGFAIPINRVKKIVDLIKSDKKLDRDFYVGMDVREIDDQISAYLKTTQKEGVIVFSIERRSPADNAGIEPGDIILKINDKSVHKADDYLVEVGDAVAGEKMYFEILRGDDKIKKTVTLEKRKGRE